MSSPQSNPEMEKYAATKNLENRLIAYSLMIIGILLGGALFFFALTSGNVGAFLILGIPGLIVVILCLLGIRRIARLAKR